MHSYIIKLKIERLSIQIENMNRQFVSAEQQVALSILLDRIQRLRLELNK